MPKDVIGHELTIGDKVHFMQKEYRHFIRGTILSFAELSCLIEHPKTNVGQTKTRQFYNQVFLNTEGWAPGDRR